MPALPRVLQKIFGGNSSNNGQPGSARAGTFNLTNNVGTLQALPAWENGWNDITLTGSRLPCLEEDQAINYVVTSQIAYILQRGIPEYDATTTYFQNCVAIESGTVKLYKSLTADNVGNALSDPVNWQLLVDFDAIVTPPFNNYAATTDPTVNDDSGDGYSPGSIWYNSTGTGEAFLCTDATVGAAKWIKTTLTVDELGSAAFVNTGTTNGTVPLIGAGDKLNASVLPAATTSASGAVELSTDAEFQTGTDTNRAVTPSNIRNSLSFSDFYESPQQTITAAGGLTLTHGLPTSPKLCIAVLQCTTANAGYSVGDEVPYGPFNDYDGTNSRGVGLFPDATNIGVRYASTTLSVVHKSTGLVSNITLSSWRLVVRAWG